MSLKGLSSKRVLVIGAHPDDIELGCGATLARYSSTWDTHCLILSRNDQNPQHGSRLVEQARASLTSLGIKPEGIDVCSFNIRHFLAARQEIADKLAKMRVTLKPDLVLSHSAHDLHQDHTVVAQEVYRIFRQDILAFEILRSSLNFEPNVYIPIQLPDAQKKITALSFYDGVLNRDYLKEESQLSHLRIRGIACNSTYAESFEAFRLVIDG